MKDKLMRDILNPTRRALMIGATASVVSSGLIAIGVNDAKAQQGGVDLDVALAPRILGDEDAPILMAEYFSLSCSHCANFHHGAFEDIKTHWIDTGKLRFEMRDFPLGRPALFAHALARSVPMSAYSGMIDLLFKKQNDWATSRDPLEELAKIARIAGIGREAFTDIIQNRPLLEGIVAIAQQGHDTYQINSTPSFVINEDRVLRGSGDYDRFLSVLSEFEA